jgi:hypothetical protein
MNAIIILDSSNPICLKKKDRSVVNVIIVKVTALDLILSSTLFISQIAFMV